MTRGALRVGTRGSRLSLLQTELVVHALREHAPDVTVDVVVVQTAGDRAPDVPLERLEGIGFFARDLEAALLNRRCDLAVHSAKDLPTEIHPALCLPAYPAREDPRDVLITRAGLRLATLPAGARMATSSLRRSAQLLHQRPDLRPVSIRGNIDTRLAKLEAGACDALCLAAAGLLRMGWAERISEWLPVEIVLPAPGQGALAVEARRSDPDMVELARRINHEPTAAAVEAERAMVSRLGSGCRAPAAALAVVEGGTLRLDGLVATTAGDRVYRHRESGPVAAPQRLGTSVAAYLLTHAGFALGEARPVEAAPEGALGVGDVT